jgi:hypothetical protein
MTTIRSRMMHRILRLHAQANRQALREARATARAILLGRRLRALRTEARALEEGLNGSQRAELARARACPVPASAAPPAPRMGRRAGEALRCPVTHLRHAESETALGSTEA